MNIKERKDVRNFNRVGRSIKKMSQYLLGLESQETFF